MKVSLQTHKHPETSVFVELDPLTQTHTKAIWTQTLADVAGLVAIGAVGFLAMIVL